jgi:MscS family membrane protein
MEIIKFIHFLIDYSFLGNPIINYIRFFLILLLTLFSSKFLTFLIKTKLIKKFENKEFFLKESLSLYLIPIVKLTLFSFGTYFAIIQISIGEQDDILRKIVKIAISILFIYYLSKISINWIEEFFKRKEKKQMINQPAIDLLIKIIKILIYVIVVLFILSSFGYDTTTFLTGLGVGGLAFALAAQDLLKNLFAGITLIFGKTFNKGEKVSFEGKTGFIEEVSLRTTKLRTTSGSILTVPNSKLSDSILENVTKKPSEKIEMDIGLVYNTPVKKIKLAKKIIEDVIKKEEVTDKENIWVWFDNFGDFSLNVKVIFFGKLKQTDWPERAYFKDRINLNIKERFEKEKIEFAFPTQTIEIKK